MSAGREPFRRIALVASLVAAAFVALPFATSASSHREAPCITEEAQGRRHRLLHVPQLRGRPRGLRHARRRTTCRSRIPTAGPTTSRSTRTPATRSRSTTTATRARTSRSGSASATSSRNIALPIGHPGKRSSVCRFPLINVGPIAAGDNAALNVVETYTVDDRARRRQATFAEERGDRRRERSRSRSTTSATSRSRTTRPTPRPALYDVAHPRLRSDGRAVRRPAQGPVRRQPGRDLRPRQPHEPARARSTARPTTSRTRT